jgi:1-acyl-sn-glycerol-3-phosphate acyltransferase
MFASNEFLRNIIQGYTWLSHRSCEVSGNTSLPRGAKIIALNHTNGCDPFFLPLILNEPPHFLLQDGLFNIPVVGSLLKQSGQIPVYRGTDRARDAFDQACQLLREGKTIVIFPEGRLVPAGKRIQAKTGTIRMALETGTPIIPVGLYVPPQNLINVQFNSHGCPQSGLWQLTGKSYMRFGTAWNPIDRPAQANDLNCRVMTDELMNRIYTLVTEIEKEVPCGSHTLLNPVFQ